MNAKTFTISAFSILSMMAFSAAAQAAEAPSLEMSEQNINVDKSLSKDVHARSKRDWDKPITGFHPIKRLVRPVWKLRKEAQDLEHEIVLLQKPMNEMQPAFSKLDVRMAGVQDSLGSTTNQLSGLSQTLGRISDDVETLNKMSPAVNGLHEDLSSIASLRQDIHALSTVHDEVRKVNEQLKRIEKPMARLEPAVSQIRGPLNSVETSVSSVSSQIQTVETKVASLETRIDKLSAQLQGLHEPLHSVSDPLKAVNLQLADLNRLLVAGILVVLSASIILAAGFLSVVAILIYRFRGSVAALLTRDNATKPDKRIPVSKIRETLEGPLFNSYLHELQSVQSA